MITAELFQSALEDAKSKCMVDTSKENDAKNNDGNEGDKFEDVADNEYDLSTMKHVRIQTIISLISIIIRQKTGL